MSKLTQQADSTRLKSPKISGGVARIPKPTSVGLTGPTALAFVVDVAREGGVGHVQDVVAQVDFESKF
jgi:hypothetical protein